MSAIMLPVERGDAALVSAALRSAARGWYVHMKSPNAHTRDDVDYCRTRGDMFERYASLLEAAAATQETPK